VAQAVVRVQRANFALTMASSMCVVLFFAVACPFLVVSTAGGSDSSANPIRKIVTLMQDMQKEIEAEGGKEKELYEKFMCYCSGNNNDMQAKVQDGEAKVEELTSAVKEEKAEQAQLKQDLIQHGTDRTQAAQDLDKAAGLRNKERQEYEASVADMETNLASITNAIPALEKGMAGASFAQLPEALRIRQLVESSHYANSYDRSLLTSFIDQTGDSVPGAGQIVGILKSMKEEMADALKETKADEQRAGDGFQDLKVAKEQEAAVATKAVETKTKRSGELGVSIVQNEDSVEDTTDEVAETKKFVATLAVECQTKEKEWAERSKLRAEEISAISEAITILNDDDALDVFKKAAPSAALVQQSPEFGFLQAKRNQQSEAHKVAAALESAAELYRSNRLGLVAYAMRTTLRLGQKSGHKSNFAEIQQMIADMIALQHKEQANDESHVEFCKAEFRTSDGEQKDKEDERDHLSAAMEEMKSEIDEVAGDLKTLAESIQGLDKAVAEATEQRKLEHAQYVQDAQLTQTAVQLIGKAKNRLMKFYNPALHKAEPKPAAEESLLSGAAASASFLQQSSESSSTRHHPAAPTTWSFYQKETQKAGGVMGLMDMITKEMESDAKEAELDEKTAQKDYTELMGESKTSRETDTKSITTKESAKAQMEGQLTDAKEKQALTMDQLEHIHGVISDLHASCDFIMENFDLRKTARTAEIDSLTNAKALLAGASFGL